MATITPAYQLCHCICPKLGGSA